MRRVYTEEQREWLLENYPEMTNSELADAFNERFGESTTRESMKSYGSNHHLRKTPDALGRTFRKYTDEQLDWIRSYVPGHTEPEIADAFQREFGISLTRPMVRGLKTNLGVKSGTHGGRFEKGQKSRNKGLKWDDYLSKEAQERSRRTTFKKGNVPHNAFHRLLDEKTDKFGTWVYVRPRDRKFPANDWISKQRFVWMQHNGRDWPDGCKAVFADHDSTNMDPENIVPVPNDIYMIVVGGAHGRAMPYHDRETLDLAILHARLMRKRRSMEDMRKDGPKA